jgi:hypothetical protein
LHDPKIKAIKPNIRTEVLLIRQQSEYVNDQQVIL